MVKNKAEFPYAEPPENWRRLNEVKCVKGMRWWIEKGSGPSFRLWLYDLLDDKDYKEKLIPLQCVAEFVGVTRAAVHKRAKAGKLTVFTFIFTEPEKELVRKGRMRAISRCDFAVMSECEAWGHSLSDQYAARYRKMGARLSREDQEMS
jgi:hypothetical protein